MLTNRRLIWGWVRTLADSLLRRQLFRQDNLRYGDGHALCAGPRRQISDPRQRLHDSFVLLRANLRALTHVLTPTRTNLDRQALMWTIEKTPYWYCFRNQHL
jgi:hypothetical protein